MTDGKKASAIEVDQQMTDINFGIKRIVATNWIDSWCPWSRGKAGTQREEPLWWASIHKPRNPGNL